MKDANEFAKRIFDDVIHTERNDSKIRNTIYYISGLGDYDKDYLMNNYEKRDAYEFFVEEYNVDLSFDDFIPYIKEVGDIIIILGHNYMENNEEETYTKCLFIVRRLKYLLSRDMFTGNFLKIYNLIDTFECKYSIYSADNIVLDVLKSLEI